MSQDPELGEMIAIPIKEFIALTVVPVDLFVRLSEQKHVLIAKQDSKGATAQIQGLIEKRVEFLYMRKDDYARYSASSVTVAGLVLTQKELSAAKKAEFLTKASATVLSEIESLGMSAEAFEHARLISNSMTMLVEAKLDLFNLLNALSQTSDREFAHSVGTSAIAVMIAKTQGWTKPATFEKLALGCLLHDVGLKELPAALVAKPRAELTAEELATYETHPYRSMEILRSIPSAPEDVIAIAYEHHENALGMGYPRKLRDLRMNPLAKVASLADAFAEITLGSGGPRPVMSPIDALRHIEVVMGQPFNREAFTALKVLVKKDLKDVA